MNIDYSIECALIEAENKGLEGESALDYAANVNHVPRQEAERVYEFLHTFQDRIADRLGIAL